MNTKLLVILMLLPCLAQAELFKWKDAEGNIIYSDQPPPGAEKEEHRVKKETLPPIITTPALVPTEEVLVEDTEGLQEEPMERYESVAIVFPEHDTALRQNAGNVSIKVAIKPYLFNERGDLLVIYMDDQEIARGNQTSVELLEVDRGTHIIRAEIVNDKGSIIKESEPISFTLLRHSRLFNTN